MSWIETMNRRVDFLNLEPDMICLEDIVRGLAHSCRYSGHTPKFYSVAEHSVHVASVIAAEQDEGSDRLIHRQEDFATTMLGALHDASEAYLNDIPTPLKQLLPDYKAFEKKFEQVIEHKYRAILYGADRTMVKRADATLLYRESVAIYGYDKIKSWAAFAGMERRVSTFKPTYAEPDRAYTMLEQCLIGICKERFPVTSEFQHVKTLYDLELAVENETKRFDATVEAESPAK